MLRTNFTARRTFVRLRVTHGKPWFSLSVLHHFLFALKSTIKKASMTTLCIVIEAFFVVCQKFFHISQHGIFLLNLYAIMKVSQVGIQAPMLRHKIQFIQRYARERTPRLAFFLLEAAFRKKQYKFYLKTQKNTMKIHKSMVQYEL